MKLAVSNIAWSPAQRDEAYALLSQKGIQGLEIAPGLFFDKAGDPFHPEEDALAAAMTAVRDAGLQLVSMQSLLFGVDGAGLFEGDERSERFRQGMKNAIRLAGKLRIPNLVFGSPLQRNIPDALPLEKAERFAIDIFRELGDEAAAASTIIGIEFNPQAYRTNFLNTANEALQFVSKVDHLAVGLTLDVGALHMNAEFDMLASIVENGKKYINHVHISEPNLLPAPASINQTICVFEVLDAVNYNGWCSIEMKAVSHNDLFELDQSISNLLHAAERAKS